MAAITKSAHERLQKKYDKLSAAYDESRGTIKDMELFLDAARAESGSYEREIERFHELLDELPDAPPREVREDGETRVLSITARFILSKR